MTKDNLTEGFTFKYLKNDLPAGIVVFLVALPLCLGIAHASGAPLFSGIITGIIGGIVVSLASGSSLSVSGPAAGLAVVVKDSIGWLGSFELFLLAVVLGGVLQMIFGFLKAGVIGYYFPSSVIKGMLAAIGILLILKQIPHALGRDGDDEGDESFVQADGETTFTEIWKSLENPHAGALIIALLSLGILILWERPFLRKYALFRTLPGALFAVVIGTLLNEWFKVSNPGLYLSGKELVVLPVAGSVSGFFSQFTLPDFSGVLNYKVWVTAGTIALIASIESLLSVEATDKLDPYKRNTPTNRELKAQGLGNFLAGIIGGLPHTAVIVRSSANVNSGARTRLSAFIHGILLLLSIIAFASVLNKIPLACLAAVLLMVGYKLAKVSLFKSMYRLGWDQFLPFVITVIAIQFSNLLAGIGIGMCVSVFFILRNNYRRGQNYLDKDKKHDNGTITIHLSEEVTFLNKGSLAMAFSQLPDDAHVIIDGTKSKNIDMDVVEMIHDFKSTATLKRIKLELKSIPEFNGVAAH